MNANMLRDVFLFVLANGVGFSGSALAYHTAVLAGFFVPGEPGGPGGQQVLLHQFYQGTMMTWMVCALFSLCFFFIQGRARYVFLLASAMIPFVYGLTILASGAP